MPAENKLKATIPVPDHSDLRGFSYRAPTNTQGYNDDPRKARPRSRLKGQLSSRKASKGFWASVKDFFRGKKEVAERPLSPELVNHIRAVEPLPEQTKRDEDFTPRPVRELPRDRDTSNMWPG